MHYLDALLIVRNERPQYLTEWAEHYFKLGVEHIHIIEHTPSNTKMPYQNHARVPGDYSDGYSAYVSKHA